MNTLDDFLAACDGLIADAEGAAGLILAPVEVLLANRFGIPLDAVQDLETQSGSAADRMGKVRLLQEEQIYKLLVDGHLKDSTALLLLKNVCHREVAEPETLESKLRSLLGDLHGEDAAA
jgi:hypothetical protein